MQHLAKRSLALTFAAGGLLAVGASCAVADSSATGNAHGSPGVLSGNTVQVPVNVPVNVCGITVDVLALLNPAAGNLCVNDGGSDGLVSAPVHHSSAPPVLTSNPAPDEPSTSSNTTTPSNTPTRDAIAPTAATLATTGAGDVAGYAAVGGTLIAGGILARRLAGRHARRTA